MKELFAAVTKQAVAEALNDRDEEDSEMKKKLAASQKEARMWKKKVEEADALLQPIFNSKRK